MNAQVYFDSTHLPPEALARARSAAAHQNELVMQIFHHMKRPLSASEVWHIGTSNGMHWPLTSPRRAISTLTADGLLEKTEVKRTGEFGAPEYLWTLPVYAARQPDSEVLASPESCR